MSHGAKNIGDDKVYGPIKNVSKKKDVAKKMYEHPMRTAKKGRVNTQAKKLGLKWRME